MQIVLSGNRVISYGDNCFLAMGGTVICEETGKAYSNATIAEVETLPADIDSVGYEYHAGVFIPCAPYGKDNGSGTILVACEDCKTPKDSGLRIDEIIGARLIVTAPAGCVVICTNGDKIVKGIYKNGVYVCNLTDYGEWTVTAGRWHGLVHETASGAVTVDIVKQYALTLGAAIAVEYPEGSTVTCTNGDVVLSAPDTSGAWTFDVLAYGDWELYCTDGEKETSGNFTVSEGGQTESVKLAYFAAYIEVTYPANSTCTCTDGVTTFTDTNSTDSEKTVTFTVPNAGTWTVTATDGTDTASKTAEITSEGQSVSVALDYTYWLYNAGDECTAITGGWKGVNNYDDYTEGSITKNASSIKLTAPSARSVITAQTTKKVRLTGFNTLKINLTAYTGGTGCGALVGIFSSDATEPVSSLDFTSKGTKSLDISNYSSGSYYVEIECYAESNATSANTLTFNKIWLE